MSASGHDDSNARPLERLPSGVPGLDTILRGGLFRGGVYMILASPGAGKTILGNQICFRHVAAGGRALFVTLLAESHARMVAQMRVLDFFDSKCVGQALSYLTGYQTLEEAQLKGLLTFLRRALREQKATLLVIDGLVTASMMAQSDLEMKKFVHELQILAELMGCTTLLLTGTSKHGEDYAQRTMVDGLIELHLDTVGMEAARSIVVTKFRGSGYLTGRHPFEITDAGITIYPRIESRRGNAAEAADSSINTAAAFGIPSLDAMLGGGLRPATTTMVRGAPGTGKTLLGLKFLEIGAAAQPREPGLYFGLRDGPTTLCRRAARVGIVLDAHVRAGLVDIVVLSPLPTIADAIAEKVLSAVKERGVKRLFIDGLCWFGESPAYPERAGRFFVALCNELAAMGVTTVFAHETDIQGLMGRLDNIINVGRVPRDGRVHRVISVTRARDGAGDSLPHVVSFDTEGIRVSGPLTRGEPAAGDAFGFDPHGESSRAGEGDSP